MERNICPTPYGNFRTFKEAQTWIKIYCFVIRQVRRRLFQKWIAVFLVVAFHFYECIFRLNFIFKPFFAIYHFSILSYSKPIDHRHRMKPHKRSPFFSQHWPVCIAVMRIRPIQNDDFHAVFRSRLHYISKRRYIGIKSNSHILNIKQNNIQILHMGWRRFFGICIKRNYRNACLGIHSIFHNFPSICHSTKAVFRSKNPFYGHSIFFQKVYDALFFLIDGHQPCLIGYHSHRLSF